MNSEYFNTSIKVKKSAEEAFLAIQNFRAWWSEQIEGNTDQLGETFFYHYKDIHLCKIKLSEILPNKKVVYDVVDNHFSFTQNPQEWKGTQMIFELTENEDTTHIQLTHKGLSPEHECYNICNESWTNYIQKSLYELICFGKGHPNPADGEGFNAEIVEKWKLN